MQRGARGSTNEPHPPSAMWTARRLPHAPHGVFQNASLSSLAVVMLPSLPVPKRPLQTEVDKARREADRAAAKAAEAERKLQALLRAQQELIGALVEEHRVLSLRTNEETSTVKHMDAAISQKTKKIGRPIESKHPFVRRAVELYGSVKAAANKLDVSPSTARSWYAEGEEARPIPELWAERLSKKPWNIPRTAWRAVK
jgi:hypothetical protein